MAISRESAGAVLDPELTSGFKAPSEQMHLDDEIKAAELEKKRAHIIERLMLRDSNIIMEIESLDTETALLILQCPGVNEQAYLTEEDISLIKDNWTKINDERRYTKQMQGEQDGNAVVGELDKRGPGRALIFEKLKTIEDPEVARILIDFNGTLYFSEVTELNDEILAILCKHEGPLFLPALEKVSDKGMQILAERGLKTHVPKLKFKILDFKQQRFEKFLGSRKAA